SNESGPAMDKRACDFYGTALGRCALAEWSGSRRWVYPGRIRSNKCTDGFEQRGDGGGRPIPWPRAHRLHFYRLFMATAAAANHNEWPRHRFTNSARPTVLGG